MIWTGAELVNKVAVRIVIAFPLSFAMGQAAVN